MQQQTISVDPGLPVRVSAVAGDLRVAGWERAEVMAKTDGDRLTLVVEDGEARVACDENLILYLPRAAALIVESVAGDASLQALHGPLRLGPVAGDVTMNDLGPVDAETIAGDASLRHVGPFSAKSISGDFVLRGCKGDCVLETVGGDASLRDVEGRLVIQSVGSDLYARGVRGGVNVSAGADVTLYLEPGPNGLYHVSAGDDLLLRLPKDAQVELHLVGSDPQNIQVDIPGVELSGDASAYDLVLGPQTENIAKMHLTAGGDLLVTSRADAWDSAAEFGVGMRDASEWSIPEVPPIPPIPPIPPDLSERINRRVQAAMERSRERVEAASRRAEIKVEAAMRRAEAKARAAEVRARRGQVQMNIGRWNWDLTPRGPVEKADAVTEAERLQILKMLQEKKITVEEAEKLLAALEGKL